MARSEQEVATELAQLRCLPNAERVQVLAEALAPGETILDAIEGRTKLPARGEPALLVATDERLISIRHKTSFFGNYHGRRAPFLGGQLYWQDTGKVRILSSSQRVLDVKGCGSSGRIQVQFVPGGVDSSHVEKFVQLIQKQVAAAHALQAPCPPQTENFADQLERLAILRDQGQISREEFEIAKWKLLQE